MVWSHKWKQTTPVMSAIIIFFSIWASFVNAGNSDRFPWSTSRIRLAGGRRFSDGLPDLQAEGLRKRRGDGVADLAMLGLKNGTFLGQMKLKFRLGANPLLMFITKNALTNILS